MSALARRISRIHVGRKARGLMPDRLFFGPVFGVQMRVSGRQRGTYLVRFFYAGILTFIACVGMFSTWAMSEEVGTGASARALQMMQTIAPEIARAIAIFQFIALVLVAPVSLGPSLGDERRTGTLSALLTTPMTALQIVCSRLAAQTVHLIVLTLVAAPLLLAIRVFGGVSAWSILALSMLCVSTALVGASLSILLSLGARRGATAAASAVFLQILLWVAPPAVAGILQYYKISTPSLAYFIFCPPAMLGELVSELGGRGLVPGIYQSIWVVTVAYNLAITAGAVLLAALRLRRLLNVAPLPIGAKLSRRLWRTRAATPATSSTSNSEATSTPGVPEAPTRQRDTTREVADRPVLWREMRQGAFAHRWQGLITLLAMVGLLGYLYSQAGIEVPQLQMPTVAILTFLLLAGGAARSGSAIAGERESRTWEVLCTTPLTARAILIGKLAGILRRLWIIPAVLALHLAISVMAGALPPESILLVFLGIAPAALFQACSGLWFSASQNKPTIAATLNLALGAVLWMVLPMLVGITMGFLGQFPAFAWVRHAEVLGVLHPLVIVLTAIDGGLEAAKDPLMAYQLPGMRERLIFAEFLAITCVQAAIYLGLGYGFWRLTLARLRKTTGRLD